MNRFFACLLPPRRKQAPAPRVLLPMAWLLAALLALLPRLGQAQAPPTFCTTATDQGTMVFTTTFQNTATLASGTSYFWRFTAVAGQTYSFSNCAGGSGDTYLRVYAPSGTVVAQNDDFGPYCTSSSAASLDWLVPAGQGGTYFIHLAQFGCGPLNGSTTLAYKASVATVTGPPTVTSFSPTSGTTGTSVTLTGTNLNALTGVSFGGTAATIFSSGSGTSATATVPAGATSGVIAATSGQGTGSSTGSFTVLATPTLSSFSPATGAVGTTVTVTGTNLDGVTSVQIGGATATSVAVVGGSGNTQLTAVVGTGAQSGRVVLNYGGGSATSVTDFVVPQATISRVEYFLDSDPGFGLATALTLPATPASDLSSLSASIPLGALSTGFHQLGVRSLDSNGFWSLTNARSFYYEPALTGALPNINKAEYFIDIDPGFGLATDIPITTPAIDVSGLAFNVNLAVLAAGFHSIGVRSRDANNKWSLTNVRTFYYEPALTGVTANVNKVEYFIDTDPGFGLATDVPITTPATDVSGLAFNVSLASLSSGFHTLSVRSKDANNKWSLTNVRTFYYELALTGAVPNIVKAEYFIDTDPGFGTATDVPITTPATNVGGLAFNVPLASLSSGFHTLSVRSKDANNKWSLTNVRTFYYEPALTGAVPNIVKAEYFIDADPGFGTATDVPITTPATDVSGLAFNVPLAALAVGFHTLSVRSKDVNNKWSLTSVRTFYYETNLLAAPNINKIEYYFDNDPGFGSATNVPVLTPAPDLPNFSFAADASALADGSHRVFFRSRDANGKWSLVSSKTFVKNGCASSANLTAGLPSTNYGSGGSMGNSPELAFNTDPASPNTSNSVYAYNGSLIQADMGSAQTISEVRLKFTNSPTTTNFTLLIQTAAALAGPYTTVDTYAATFNANGFYPVVRTLATPATNVRVLRLVFQNSGGNYVIVSGAGAYYFNCASPNITSFTPTGGGGGTVVTLTGTNLSGATAVTFNGVAASVATITGNTNLNLTVTAPAGGTSGPICVTTPAGTACSSGSFAYPPTIATGAVSSSAFCASTLIQVSFTTNTADYGVGNLYRFQLSGANGVFTAGSRLYGTLISQNASGGILRDSVAFRTPAGTGYRVRVVASNPSITGTDNGTNLTIYPMPPATASGNSPVVYNGTIQLAAQPVGQSSYQWYVNYNSGGSAFVGSGQTLNLTNAQPTQSGKYFVYVTNANSCQDSASVRVLVQPNAVPVLTMSQFSFNGCAGTTLNIGFSVTGNNFQNGNVITAQLSDASGSFAAPTAIGSAPFTGQGGGSVSSTIPTNTPTGTGYRVRMVGSNPAVTSTSDNGSNLTITTQPTATASSNSPVAFNGTVQLTAQTVVGASYIWTGPGFSSGVQNPTIPNATLSNGGTYTLYVTVNGCQSPGSPTTVVVNPSPQPILSVAQFSGTLCPGTGLNIGFSVTGNNFGAGNVIMAQLSNASGSFAAPTAIGTTNFTGQGGGSVVATIPQNVAAGTGYRIRMVGSNPAVTSTNDNGANLTVPTALVATASGNSPVASGGTLQLFSGPTGAATYQWFVDYTTGGTAFISSQQNPAFNNVASTASGFYYVFITQGGCTDSASVRVLVNPPVTTTLTLNSFVQQQLCVGGLYTLQFTVGGAGLNNGTVTAQLSDASGSFAAPTTLNTVNVNGTRTNNNLSFGISGGAGTGYRIRLVSTNPSLTSADNGSDLTISNLTNVVASSNSPVASGALIQFSSSGVPTGATIGWTGPNSFSSNQPNPSIPTANAANAGTYNFSVSLNGCSVTRQVQLVVGTPAVAIATGGVSGSLCPGTPVSVPYSVTTGSMNGGNTFTVQLSNASGSFASPVSIGSLASAAASGTVAAVIPASTPAGSGYRVRVVADNPATVGSDNGSNLTVGPLIYAWTGGVSTDWFNGANWSCGQVPNASSVVTIGSGASFYPVITGSVTALALHLTIQTGATFTNNGTFYLYGNVTNFGTSFASNASFWYFLGGTTQFVYGTNQLQLGSVVISSATTLTLNNLIYVNANWNNFGNFVGGSGYAVYFNGVGNQFIGGTAVTNFSNVFVNSGSVLNLNIGAVFLSNLTTLGTFNAQTYGVTFAGSAAQTIGGAGGTTFYTVNITNTVGVTLVSNITVLGNWINNGTFLGSTYSVVFAGTAAQLIGGTQVTNFYNVNFQNPVSVTLAQNIYVLGGFANSGVFYGYQTVGGATAGYFVRFGGSAAQVITANATTYFYHFYVDNSAGVSLATNIYIAGNYYLYSGGFAPGTFTVFFNGFEGPAVVQTVGGYAGLSFYGWNIVSGAYVRLIQNVTWLGSFANAGTFYGYNLVGGVYTGYTSVFGGSGAQSLTGPGVYEFWHVGWNNLAGITLNQNISVWGNWLNSGGYLANGYLVNFIGNAAQVIGGTVNTVFHHITITNLVSVTLNQPITVLGNWGGTGVFLGSTYLVYFNGTAAQTILTGLNTRFFDLRFNNAVSVTLLSNLYLNGNWTHDGGFVANGFRVFFSGSAVQLIAGSVLTQFHHLTILSGAQVQLGRAITMLGDWTNNGSFLAGTYSVVFAGTAAQLIGGTQVTNFYNVNFQNPVSVTLAQNIYVLGGFANSGVFYGYQTVGGATAGYFVRFGGSAAQVITANATTYFYHFYVDNSAGVSLATNIYIAGNYYLYSGGFAPGTFTVFFNGFEGPAVVQTVGGYAGLSFYGWNIVSGAYVRLIQNVTWLGSFANAGTFYGYNLVGGVYTGYTSVFGGSGAQSLTGPGVYEFWHVGWNNLAGITLNQNISVWGNWLNSGGYLANGYLVNFIGNAAQVIGGTVNTVFHHITITNLVSVTLNQPITVLGNWGGTGVFLGSTYLVYFNGTAAQTILTGLNTRFFDLRFNNAVSVTLLSNLYLNGNWTHDGGFVANGFRVFFSGSAVQLIAGSVLTQFHHLTILSGAQVQLGRAITMLGDWTNNGTFLHGNFTVLFGGTAAQLIGGGVSTIFYGITFSNPVSVTLAQNIRVRGGWLNNGVFVPATYTVFFDGSIAQIIGGTAVSTFFGLNVLNTVGVSLSGPIFIRGNLVNDGLFTCVGYLVTFNGTALQTIGGLSTTVFGNLTTNNAVGVALGQNIRVQGNFLNQLLFTAGGFAVTFDGSVAQTITSAGTLTFYNVVFANLAGVTLQNNVFLTGNWTNNGGFLANGKLVTFNGTVLQLIGGTVATVFHHFTIALGASVQQNLGITLLGDWTNNGSFLHNNLLTYFNGTVLQTLGGSALSIFYDVTFNNAVNVSLAHDIDVKRHFVNQGGYCGCGFLTRFNGTVAQTITCTSGRTHFHDLTFANTAGVTLLDGIFVSGLWANNGGYLANNQTVIFDGAVLQTIGGSVLSAFYNVGITNTVNVQLLRDISVGGFWNNTGIFRGNGFLVTFNGLALQTITTTGALARSYFHHITWTNLVGCVLGGDIYVAGNWLCNGPFNPATWTVYFNGLIAQSCGGLVPLRFFGLNCSNTAGVTYTGPVTLLGNYVNTGLVNCGPYAWTCLGTSAQTLGGISTTPTRFYDLIIQNGSGVTATDNWLLTHLLTLPIGNLASNGHLTLTSDATGTAMVVNPTGGGVVTGISTMERFITGLSGAPGYRHYSSPMKLSAAGISTTVQEFADNLPVFELNPAYNTVGNTVTPFPTLFKYDETRLTAAKPTFSDGFLVPTAFEDLVPLRGYTAQTLPTTTVDISGLLQTGNVSYTLSRGSFANSGWQLLGNPYPAPMDWDVVRTTTGMLTGVADALYVFQPSGQYTGTYKAYVNGLGQNGGTKDLAAMQGFFVRATAATGSVSFTNAVRATSYLSPSFSRQLPNPKPVTSSSKPVLRLEARNVANATADETVIYFEPAAGLGFSAQHDAYKVQLNGNGRPSLWSQAGTEGFAINGLPDLATAPVIPLGVRVSQDGNHELVLTALADAPVGTQVWLEDRVLNRRQNLAASSTYAFSMLANYTGQRFYLNFVAASPLAVTTGKLDARTALYPNPTTGKATLELAGLREQGAVKVELVNVLGQTVRQLHVQPKLGFLSQTLDLSGLPTGVYTVRIYAQEGTAVKRLVKE